MVGDAEARLIECVDAALRSYSFKRLELTPVSSGPELVAAWKRKTWNTNRGVAMVRIAEGTGHPGEFARRVAKPIGVKIGYLPFLYELGLQLILTGSSVLDAAEGLDRYVSRINTFGVVLQSIHVVDYEMLNSISVRTWGQVVTGRFQDAIEKGIRDFLSQSEKG